MAEAPNTLVAYASEHGSTRGIAERIGNRLAQAGARITVLAVDDVADVAEYDAVVLGSGVYRQRWIPSATQFVRTNRAALAGLSGLRVVDGSDRLVGSGFWGLVVYDLNGVGCEWL